MFVDVKIHTQDYGRFRRGDVVSITPHDDNSRDTEVTTVLTFDVEKLDDVYHLLHHGYDGGKRSSYIDLGMGPRSGNLQHFLSCVRQR